MSSVNERLSLTDKQVLVVCSENNWEPEIVEGLVSAGCKVFLAGSDKDAMTAIPGVAGVYVYDHCTKAQTMQMLETALEKFGAIDALVENSLYTNVGGWDQSYALIYEQLEKTHLGMMLTVQAVGKVIAEQGHGSVVIMSETGALSGYDMVKRIIDSDRLDQKCVMIMCNPNPTYRKVAYMLRQMKVNMRNVKFYMMDEWADEDGNIAPLSYKAGFGYAFQEFMIKNIQGLGFKEENFIYHSNEITPVFSKMLEDDGEADCVYSGPGWPGHLAFIDPVEDWYQPTMEEYLAQPAKVASLHPLTIAQNSLHGGFGYSGDISKVPPKGAMMGPRDAMKAKNVLDVHGITTAGSQVSWQRLTSRLCIFGEPSQTCPASILQLRENPTHIIMSDNLAATIQPDDFFQY